MYCYMSIHLFMYSCILLLLLLLLMCFMFVVVFVDVFCLIYVYIYIYIDLRNLFWLDGKFANPASRPSSFAMVDNCVSTSSPNLKNPLCGDRA